MTTDRKKVLELFSDVEEPKPDIDNAFVQPKESSAVDLERGSITPITREEIKQVDSAAWSDMSVRQLHEQKFILDERRATCARYSPGLVRHIDAGIAQIQKIIDEKSGTTLT